MSTTKKLVLGVVGTAGALLLILLVLPLFLVGSVEERVRAEVERAARVRIDWSDLGLGLVGDFPNARLSLRDLTVVGTGSFEGDTLASVGDFRLSLGLGSVVRVARGGGPLEVRSVEIREPRLRLRVGEDGVANWDVLSSSEGEVATERGEVAVSLQRFELSDGSILYDDASTDTYLAIEGLEHTLRGDFSRASLVASTSVRADAVELRFAGTPYLGGVSFAYEGDFDVDVEGGEVRLAENELRLNELLVRFAGSAARGDDGTALDLTFEAPSSDFGEVLSLVPVIYARDFVSLETTGTFTLDGRVSGTVGAGTFPSFALNLDVNDGSFRYPDLPLPARAISADLAVANAGGDPDSTVVDLSAFHVEIGEQSLDAAFTLRTPLSDPAIDARVEGTVDLADVARTIKVEDAGELAGVIQADASMRARRSDVDEARYDRIAAEGSLSARGVTVHSPDLRQPVEVAEAELRFTPRTAELRTFDARLGSSDVRASGRLDNVLGFAIGDQPLRGAATLRSRRFVLDEWRSEGGGRVVPVPAMLDLSLDGTVDELLFDDLEMRNASGRGTLRDERVTLEDFSLETFGGRVTMNGFYETLDPTAPSFAFDLGVDSLDVGAVAESFVTVRGLAPVARYTVGTFSSSLALSGVLGEDFAPVIDVLDGEGSINTSRLVIEGFPPLERLGERLGLDNLATPVVQAVRSSIQVDDGRLTVQPFEVGVAGIPMRISGSNGFDQSLDYTLAFEVPRSGLADDALSSLTASLGSLGSDFADLESLPVAVRLTGSVTSPSVGLSLDEAGASLREAAVRAAAAPVQDRIDDARAEVDSTRAEARRRARARADSIVAEAERRAEQIRAEGAEVAARIRAEGDRAAEELLSRATNPLARAAAEPAAERIRREADERADQVEREADEQATALVEAARERADALLEGVGSAAP